MLEDKIGTYRDNSILIVLCTIYESNKESKFGSTIYQYEKTNYVYEMILKWANQIAIVAFKCINV